MVRNPMNPRQVSRIQLTHDVVDGIVFWTKNPIPMLDRLDELNEYMYYFQFTITPYARDIEPNIPSKPNDIINAFKRLSKMIGSNRVIWRYDPILISARYTFGYHVHAFNKIAEELNGYTKKVTISFIDEDYRGVKSNINELKLLDFPTSVQIELSARLAEIAHKNGMTIDTCAESINLQQFGIEYTKCIDDALLSTLLGCDLEVGKDKSQRLECGCVSSIDIGMYNTCKNGCQYCFANYNKKTVSGNFKMHNPMSPLISGELEEDDKVNDRIVKSFRNAQLKLNGL